MQRWKQTLPVKLTEQEITALGRDNAQLLDEVLTLKAEIKRAQKSLGIEVETKEGQIVRNSKNIRRGHVDREVECQFENYDFQRGTKDVIRLDTMAFVEQVALTDEDRQQELSLK